MQLSCSGKPWRAPSDHAAFLRSPIPCRYLAHVCAQAPIPIAERDFFRACASILQCVNTVGSFTCTECPAGFTGSGRGPNGCTNCPRGKVMKEVRTPYLYPRDACMALDRCGGRDHAALDAIPDVDPSEFCSPNSSASTSTSAHLAPTTAREVPARTPSSAPTSIRGGTPSTHDSTAPPPDILDLRCNSWRWMHTDSAHALRPGRRKGTEGYCALMSTVRTSDAWAGTAPAASQASKWCVRRRAT